MTLTKQESQVYELLMQIAKVLNSDTVEDNNMTIRLVQKDGELH